MKSLPETYTNNNRKFCRHDGKDYNDSGNDNDPGLNIGYSKILDDGLSIFKTALSSVGSKSKSYHSHHELCYVGLLNIIYTLFLFVWFAITYIPLLFNAYMYLNLVLK